jgi:hypothetical protein
MDCNAASKEVPRGMAQAIAVHGIGLCLVVGLGLSQPLWNRLIGRISLRCLPQQGPRRGIFLTLMPVVYGEHVVT